MPVDRRLRPALLALLISLALLPSLSYSASAQSKSFTYTLADIDLRLGSDRALNVLERLTRSDRNPSDPVVDLLAWCLVLGVVASPLGLVGLLIWLQRRQRIAQHA